MLSPTRPSRQLRRPLDLGVIKRPAGIYCYCLSKAGRVATAAAEWLTETAVIPAIIYGIERTIRFKRRKCPVQHAGNGDSMAVW
jgi:hypothetical protein